MIMGMESKGMVLAAQNSEGKPLLLTVAGEVPSGMQVT
jgi:hypothetical protein